MNTIVLDGTAQLNINDGVSVQIVTSDASDAITLVLDGDSSLALSADGDCSLTQNIDGETGIVTVVHTGELPYYTGATTVIPKANAEQILQTQNTILLNNITVTEVPYWETSNTSGMTAYIANEV